MNYGVEARLLASVVSDAIRVAREYGFTVWVVENEDYPNRWPKLSDADDGDAYAKVTQQGDVTYTKRGQDVMTLGGLPYKGW